MKALSIACVVLLSLTGCGVAPAGLPSRGAAQAVDALGNVNFSTDIPDICRRVIKNQTKAKANKTNVARLWVTLDHVQNVAQKQGHAEAEAIAAAALDRHHARSEKVTGNLPTKVAEEMKADLLAAYAAILETFQK